MTYILNFDERLLRIEAASMREAQLKALDFLINDNGDIDWDTTFEEELGIYIRELGDIEEAIVHE